MAVLVYDRIEANHRRTVLLLGVFFLLMIPFVLGFVPLLAPFVNVLFLIDPPRGLRVLLGLGRAPADPAATFVASAALAALAALAVALGVTLLELRYATDLVLRATRARPVPREREPDLWRTVENLCIGAGLPLPRIHVAEAPAPNAFATGLDPGRASLVVTRGLLQLLDRRELAGVAAHELAHIGNHDTRLTTVLAALVATLRLPLDLVFRLGRPVGAGCLVVSALGLLMVILSVVTVAVEIVLAAALFRPEMREMLAQTELHELFMVGFMFFYAWLFTAAPSYVLVGARTLGLIVRGAVSRQRELLADGEAVLLTRDPEGLALALIKIRAAAGLPTTATGAVAHLYLVDPAAAVPWWDRWIASHPSIDERVAALASMGTGISPAAAREAEEAGVTFRAEHAGRAATGG
jgi:heat shock protein HtpX